MSLDIDSSKQHAAKMLGIAYLSTFVIVVYVNFGIYDPLHVAGDVGETARRIANNEHLFRLGIVLDLIYAIGFTLLLSSHYTILKDTNQGVVQLSILWHLVYVIAWVVVTLKFFDALRLVSGSNYLRVFPEENLQALARLFLSGRFDRYYGVLVFYSLGSMIFNYVWYRSAYIPKWLSLWGILSCGWCTVCAIAYLIYPDFGNIVNVWLFDLPMALFYFTLSFWLLFVGLRKPM